MPILYVLGGANGVGKTTWYQAAVNTGEIDPKLPFINIDTIVLQELGGYTTENIARAEDLARERMRDLILSRKDFIIESNLSRSSDYDWIELMRKNGYQTSLFFLGTNNVEINKIRVRSRVAEGGHDIADPIIEQRYQTGLSYLKSQIINFSSATLIDVSTDQPRKQVYLVNGLISFKEQQQPEWITQSISLAERLQLKIQNELKIQQKEKPSSPQKQHIKKQNKRHKPGNL
jgi:predicted ABC-type ATPase